MKLRPVEQEAGGQEHVGSLDGQRMMGHELHVSEGDACSESHVHTEANHARRKGALEALVSDDKGFALEPNDPPVDHVERNHAFDRLFRVNEGEWNLVTTADDAVAHALLFAHLLNGECRRAPCIRGAGLLVASALPDDGQALLISAEVQAPTFEQVHLLDGSSRCFCDDILVAKEISAANRVFAVASVVGFLQGC